MYAVCVTFVIHPEAWDAFLPRMQQQANDSLALEADCHRFDICHSDGADNIVFLYELYTDRAAFDLHSASEHFLSFAADTSGMVQDKKVATYSSVVVGQ